MNVQDYEIVAQHVRATGNLAEVVLNRIGDDNIEALQAVTTALTCGGMLSIRTTAGAIGMIIVAVELVLPDGESHVLTTIEMQRPDAPSRH
jgi:hypothetical protein